MPSFLSLEKTASQSKQAFMLCLRCDVFKWKHNAPISCVSYHTAQTEEQCCDLSAAVQP